MISKKTVLRDENNIITGVTEEAVPTFVADDGSEVPLTGLRFLVSEGKPEDPSAPIKLTHPEPFTSLSEVDTEVLRLADAAERLEQPSLEVSVTAIRPGTKITVVNRPDAIATELQELSASNGHRIDIGFHGALRDDPPGL